jgi:glycosyltransferase involved in cell wall biosynthesis
MAGGCPAILSSLECFNDFIRQGENGWIFDHRAANPAASLASVMTKVIVGIDTLEKIRESARQTARQFSMTRIADQFLSDFEEVSLQ